MSNWWEQDTLASPLDAALAAEGISGPVADIARSIYQQESGSGKNTKTSNAGARGGMQIIPATFARVADKGWNIDDPVDNARAGVRYIAKLNEIAGGDPALTAAGYYGGEGAIAKARQGVAVSDPRNPRAPNTLQYGQQVASRLPKREPGIVEQAVNAIVPSAQAAPQPGGNWWEADALAPQQPEKPKLQGKTTDQKLLETIGGAAKGFAAGGAEGIDTLMGWAAPYVDKVIPGAKQFADEAHADLQKLKKDNADSTAFTLGRFGGNVGITWPVGGALGGVVKGGAALAAGTRAAPVLSDLGTALATGGFNVGSQTGKTGLGLRIAGGAGTGGASTALIDPDAALTGALVGGVLPPALIGIGRGASKGVSAVRRFNAPAEVGTAEAIMKAGGYKADEMDAVRALLRDEGPKIVPTPATAPQLLQNQGISQLARTLHNAGGHAIREQEMLQDAARLAVLDRVSPVTGTTQQAAENFGNAMAPRIQSGDQAARRATSTAFDAIDPAGAAQVTLPIDKLDAALEKFLGPGSTGGGTARALVDEAKRIGLVAAEDGTKSLKAVPFEHLQRLRASLGDAARAAKQAGNNQEAAALSKMVGEIDATVERVVSGNPLPGEHFPADMAERWKAARDLKRKQVEDWRTGPQASAFRNGADNQPQVQGAEWAGKYFSPRRSQADDMAAFNRVRTDETRDLLKNYAVTDLAAQQSAAGRLTSTKVDKWLETRSGATKGLFDQSEMAQLRGVAQDLARADSATRLGMATGSNTAQNAGGALSLGLLDSRAVGLLAGRIPLVNQVLGPGLEALKKAAREAKVKDLSELLADPLKLEAALTQLIATQPAAARALISQANLDRFGGGLLRLSPALLTAPAGAGP